MAIKRKHPEHENHERWLVSYADFITLMFAFFVVMFASSQTDKAKAKQVSESIQRAIDEGTSVGVRPRVAAVLGGTVDDKGQGNAMAKGPGGAQQARQEAQDVVAELNPSLRALTKELEHEIKDGKLVISLQLRGLVVTLRQAAFFPSGTDEVDPKLFPVLDSLARTLQKSASPVRLEGHTDSVPISTPRFRSNWDLSAARAIAVLKVLSERCGIPPERLGVAGYADTLPVDTNETAEGRAHNRRVDLVIMSQLAMKSALEPETPKAREARTAGRQHQ